MTLAQAISLLQDVRRELSRQCWSGSCCTLRARIDEAMAAPPEDEVGRLRARVQQSLGREHDAAHWRERWREANAEGLRLREALTEIAVEDHQGMTAAQRAQAALDGDEE